MAGTAVSPVMSAQVSCQSMRLSIHSIDPCCRLALADDTKATISESGVWSTLPGTKALRGWYSTEKGV